TAGYPRSLNCSSSVHYFDAQPLPVNFTNITAKFLVQDVASSRQARFPRSRTHSLADYCPRVNTLCNSRRRQLSAWSSTPRTTKPTKEVSEVAAQKKKNNKKKAQGLL